MHARVFSTALQQDVITILGPGQSKRRVNDGAAMALALKFWMRDHVFEKAVPLSGSQQIWRGDQHAGCNDFRFRGGYKDRNAVVGQHFRPNLFRAHYRLGAGAYFCCAKKLEQRSKVGGLSESGIGHGSTEL